MFTLFERPGGRRRPPASSGEKEMLEGFLDFQRETAIWKVTGLGDEDQRQVMTPSGLSPLGLIKHLAHAERYWFQSIFAGEEADIFQTQADWDDLFVAGPHESYDVLVSRYRADIARSHQIIDKASLDDRAQRTDIGDFTLRWIMLHMIEEVSRHDGHLDIFRESLDGATGE